MRWGVFLADPGGCEIRHRIVKLGVNGMYRQCWPLGALRKADFLVEIRLQLRPARNAICSRGPGALGGTGRCSPCTEAYRCPWAGRAQALTPHMGCLIMRHTQTSDASSVVSERGGASNLTVLPIFFNGGRVKATVPV